MIRLLSYYIWKRYSREKFYNIKFTFKIIINFVFLFIISNFFLFGFFYKNIADKLEFKGNLLHSFYGILFLIMCLELIYRLILKKIFLIDLRNFNALPIRKKSFLLYNLLASTFTFVNLSCSVFFLGFLCSNDLIYISKLNFILFFTLFFSVLISNNLINYYIKIKNSLILNIFVIMLLLAIIIASFNYFSTYTLYFIAMIDDILYLLLIISSLLVTIISLFFYIFNKINFLFKIDSITNHKLRLNSDFVNFRKYNASKIRMEILELTIMDFKSILRNKKIRENIIFSFTLLIGTYFLLKNSNLFGKRMFLFYSLILNGSFSLIYGSYILNWYSGCYDFFLVQKISFYKFLSSKYIIMTFSSIVIFIIMQFYLFINNFNFILLFIPLLFNVGVSSYIVMCFSTFNPRKMNVSKSNFLNFEGIGFSQYVAGAFAALTALLIYLPFDYMDKSDWGLYTLGGLGVSGMVSHKFWLKIIAKRLNKEKYIISGNFRKI